LISPGKFPPPCLSHLVAFESPLPEFLAPNACRKEIEEFSPGYGLAFGPLISFRKPRTRIPQRTGFFGADFLAAPKACCVEAHFLVLLPKVSFCNAEIPGSPRRTGRCSASSAFSMVEAALKKISETGRGGLSSSIGPFSEPFQTEKAVRYPLTRFLSPHA